MRPPRLVRLVSRSIGLGVSGVACRATTLSARAVTPASFFRITLQVRSTIITFLIPLPFKTSIILANLVIVYPSRSCDALSFPAV